MSHWNHFRVGEFACHHCARNGIDANFITRLDVLRDRIGFPIAISSGFRCVEHDSAIGGAGVHPQGCAADIPTSGARQDILIREAVAMGFRGIGVKAKGDHASRYVHLDDLESEDHPRPRIWTY